MKYNESDVWSLPTSYNNYMAPIIDKIPNLYSGLLQNQVIDQICLKKGSVPSTPNIPEELNNCVSFQKLSKNKKGWEFSFDITHPLNKDRTTRVRAQISKDCMPSNITRQGVIGNRTASGKQNNKKQNWTIGIAVGTSVLVSASIITIFCCICSKKKNELEARVDLNPVYDGAVDYVYDEMGNDDSNEVLSRSRRKTEVKAEVVDRSSIYGEKEEGWEDAVAIDSNSYYGE